MPKRTQEQVLLVHFDGNPVTETLASVGTVSKVQVKKMMIPNVHKLDVGSIRLQRGGTDVNITITDELYNATTLAARMTMALTAHGGTLTFNASTLKATFTFGTATTLTFSEQAAWVFGFVANQPLTGTILNGTKSYCLNPAPWYYLRIDEIPVRRYGNPYRSTVEIPNNVPQGAYLTYNPDTGVAEIDTAQAGNLILRDITISLMDVRGNLVDLDGLESLIVLEITGD